MLGRWIHALPQASGVRGPQVSDPKCCDYDKRTPLHLAASEGSYKVAEWLLENKADVNALDRFKRTPLEVCVRPLCCALWHELTPRAQFDQCRLCCVPCSLKPMQQGHRAGRQALEPVS